MSRIERIIHSPKKLRHLALFTNLSFMRSKVLIPLSKFEELLCNNFFSCGDGSASIPTKAAALSISCTPSSFLIFPSLLLMSTQKLVSVDEEQELIAAK